MLFSNTYKIKVYTIGVMSKVLEFIKELKLYRKCII